MKKPIISLLFNLFILLFIILDDSGLGALVCIIYLAHFIYEHIKDKPVMTITVKKKKSR